MYGELCSEFYDADKPFASNEELKLYQDTFNKDALLLEPMCGSGRLLIPLLNLGYEIHGLDNSEKMLANCKKRAAEFDLKPTLFAENIDTFSSKQKYDGIIIPFGSFQLLYPRERAYTVLYLFRELLNPNGKLIVDLFIPWEALYENANEDTSIRQVTLPCGDIIEITNRTTTNKYQQHMLSQSHYKKISHGIVTNEEHEKMDICWYYPMEIQYLLEKYGFNDIQKVDRFLNHAEHMTIIAKRNK